MMIVYGSIEVMVVCDSTEVMAVLAFIIRTRIGFIEGCAEMS